MADDIELQVQVSAPRVFFGTTPAERTAGEITLAREILLNISQLGLNDTQRLTIINGLALELEDIRQMKAITAVVREVGESAFIAPQDQDLHKEV
jgi:hypothetical protein